MIRQELPGNEELSGGCWMGEKEETGMKKKNITEYSKLKICMLGAEVILGIKIGGR